MLFIHSFVPNNKFEDFNETTCFIAGSVHFELRSNYADSFINYNLIVIYMNTRYLTRCPTTTIVFGRSS
jgi:hypothetical protein